jgi:hypothetical protein
MARRLLLFACLAATACGRSWIFDDLVTVPETSGGTSGGHGSSGGSTGRTATSGGSGTGGRTSGTGGSSGTSGGTTGRCVPQGEVCGESQPCCAGLSCAGSGRCERSEGTSTTTTGTTTGGSSGGTTGGCSTKDCVADGDCCPTSPTECGEAGLSGCVFGVCAYGPPPCGTSGGSSGGTSGGTGTGGNAGSSGGTVGGSSGGSTGGPESCNPNASPVEFLTCASPSGCGCPLLCVHDALAGQVCEYPCTATDQCPDLLTVCNGANCQLDGCGPGTGNGSYNSFCTVTSTDDGSCIPLQLTDGTVYGVCAQGGSAVTTCNATANREDLSQVCQGGMVCIGGAIGTGGVCGDVCDPNQGGPCPSGQECAFTVDDPLAGACYTP